VTDAGVAETEGRRPRILYIDDDLALGRLVTRGLGRRGFDVTAFQDAVEAVQAAHAGYDAIGVDHYMPGQDGLATLALLKAQGVDCPVVYVTASDDIRLAIAALKAGAADYVIKSGSEDFPTLLANAFDQVIGQVALRRQKEAAEAALRAANEKLEAVVQRQATLLREVNHRVANSLQMVAALVRMQAGAVEDPAAREALADTQARITAIMQVHRRLYTSDDVQFVEMDEYLRGLVDDLEQSTSASRRACTIRLQADSVRLATDKAVSLGVVVAELVTNALKYAYAPGQAGEVRIILAESAPSQLSLVVEDDGSGMPDQPSTKGTGLGQRVMAAMATSLDSRMEFDPSHRGVRAVITFPA
jgi:two-component sensor histidine kinase